MKAPGLMMMFVVLCFDVLAVGMSVAPAIAQVRMEGKLNCPFISSGGTVFLQISLSTGDVARHYRKPMNIAVVLDRSGSMADAGKIDYAKDAVLKLIDRLDSEDIFSLVIYDDVVDVPFPARRVESKAALRRLVNQIYPRGSTNLGGGMVEGFRQVERNLKRDYVNRVILLSDGLANQGITDPGELARIARRYRSNSISLTTMGVGLEYNENLMISLSESGGGNYYFIESPHGLASIMGREMNTLSSVVAQNAMVDLSVGRGVRVKDIIGCEHSAEGGSYVIPVGDLYANDTREFTVELEVPEGHGVFEVAHGVLRCQSPMDRSWVVPSFTAYVTYTRDIAVIDTNRDWDTQAKADVAVSTRNVDRAMKALDEGRRDEAERVLVQAKEVLANSPAAGKSEAAASAISAQSANLDEYARILKDSNGDERSKKKSIQFGNYKMQKQK